MTDVATFRLISMDDYEALVAFWRKCPGLTIGDSDRPEKLALYLGRNPATNFAAEIEGRIAGTALAGHDGRRGILRHVAVLPEHQRKGIATALVERCLAALGEEGIERSYAIVLSENTEGRGFWEHRGWKYLEECHLFARGTVR